MYCYMCFLWIPSSHKYTHANISSFSLDPGLNATQSSDTAGKPAVKTCLWMSFKVWSCCQQSNREASDLYFTAPPCPASPPPNKDKRIPLVLLPPLQRSSAKSFQRRVQKLESSSCGAKRKNNFANDDCDYLSTCIDLPHWLYGQFKNKVNKRDIWQSWKQPSFYTWILVNLKPCIFPRVSRESMVKIGMGS